MDQLDAGRRALSVAWIALGWGASAFLQVHLLWPFELESVLSGALLGVTTVLALRRLGMLDGWIATAATLTFWIASAALPALAFGRDEPLFAGPLSLVLANGATAIAVSIGGERIHRRTVFAVGAAPLAGLAAAIAVGGVVFITLVLISHSAAERALEIIVGVAGTVGGAVTGKMTAWRLQRAYEEGRPILSIPDLGRASGFDTARGVSGHSTSKPTPPAPTPVMVDDDSFRYEAFISYRTVEPDRRWAFWLQRQLEEFRTPSALVRSGRARARFRRVFVDSTELVASHDLAESIEKALAASRCLIVICSRRTAESRWIARECEYFRQLGRGQSIRYLLTEGDIDPALWNAAGEPEPLAADVRPSVLESPRERRRNAVLRLASALLGCDYDELRQRERRQRRVRANLVGATAAAILLTVGISVIQSIRNRENAEATTRVRALEGIARRGDEEAVNRPVFGLLLSATALRRNLDSRDPTSPFIVSSVRRALGRVGGVGIAKAANGWPPMNLAIAGNSDVLVAAAGGELQRWPLGLSEPPPPPIRLPLGGDVYVVRSSPDGRWVIVAGASGAAFCSLSEAECRDIDTEQGYRAVAFSADSRLAAVGGTRGRLLVFRIGQPSITLASTYQADMPIIAVAFSPDGAFLAASASPGDLPYERQDVNPISLWRLASNGTLGQRFELIRGKAALAIGFSHDATSFFAGDVMGNLIMWSLSRLPNVTPNSKVKTETIESLAISERHNWLVTASSDGHVRAWRFAKGLGEPKVLSEDGGNQHYEVTTVATPLREWVGSSGAIPHAWSLFGDDEAVVDQKWSLPGHDAAATGIAISRNGRWLVTSSFDGTLRARDLTQRIGTSAIWSSASLAADNSPDGTWIVTGGVGVSTLKLDTPVTAVGTALLPDLGNVKNVAFSHAGKLVALASADGSLTVASFADGVLRQVSRSRPFSTAADVIAFDAKDRWLFASDSSGDVRVWRLPSASGDTGTRLVKPPGVPEEIYAHYRSRRLLSVGFSNDGRWIAGAFQDGALVLWSMGDGTRAPEASLLRDHDDAPSSVAFSPNDDWLLSTGLDGALVLRRFSSDGLVNMAPIVRREHKGWIVSLAVAPDGGWIATGGGMIRKDGRDSLESDSRVLLWNLKSPLAPPVKLEGHSGWVHDLAFDRTGTRLVSAADDGIRLWSIVGDAPKPIPAGLERESCHPCRFSDDGRWLVSRGGIRKGAAVWPLDASFIFRQARRVAGRNLTDAEWSEMFPGTPRAKTFDDLP